MDAGTAVFDLVMYLDRTDPFIRERVEAIEEEIGLMEKESEDSFVRISIVKAVEG